MIKKIHIKNVATLKDLSFEPLQINYIFGGNGSGKTTISKAMAIAENYSNGTIESSDNCEVLVYNKDFVDKNFQDKNAINGIFTIGESAIETIKDIEKKEQERDDYQRKITANKASMDKLQEELGIIRNEFDDTCWEIQRELGDTFPKSLVGTRNSKNAFSTECLSSFSEDVESFYELDDLINTYKQLYQTSIQEYNTFNQFSFSKKYNGEIISIQNLESDESMSKALVKASNSNFSQFIERLNNLDWISQGIEWAKNYETCPFCQRKLEEDILSELNNLFDESYNVAFNKLSEINRLYREIRDEFISYFSSVVDLAEKIEFIDLTMLQQEYNELEKIFSSNILKIEDKLAHPSLSISLQSSFEHIKIFRAEVDNLNQKIVKNNELVKNINSSRKELSRQVWDYIANHKLHKVIEQFKRNVNGKNNGIDDLRRKNGALSLSLNDCNTYIREKRKNVVCIDNAIEAINKLLSSFGFNGFKIVKRDEISYKLIRADGSEVKETLSEGEHRFISFLYFYQLVQGTLNRESTNKNKILVIDDPISSLDSNILFIVSYLVRDLILNCLSGSNVKQMFVLTHNIYFHQEITYKGRDNPSPLKERFWILRKINETTAITGYDKNQINSSYELLWKELKNPNTESTIICNIMRRILEHYFNVIGHKDYGRIIDKFEGQDRLICKALLPFINTGSHIINDDFYLSIDPDMIDKYKQVFRLIFVNANQESHYNMMMNID